MKIFLSAVMICFPVMLSAQPLSGTLEHINETGELTIGYRTGEPPMSFADQDGTPTGYIVDICRRIADDVAERLGRDDLQVTFRAVDAATRFDAIVDGTIDLLCGPTTKTLERSERVAFSQLTFVTGGAFLSLKGAEINGLGDLGGKKVAVSENTTTIVSLREAVQWAGVPVEIVPVQTADQAIQALQDGEVDAYAADQIVLIGKVLTQTDPSFSYFVSGELFSFEPFALALRRGDPDFRLLVDRTISGIYRTGEIVPIYRQWFGGFSSQPTSALAAMYELMATPE